MGWREKNFGVAIYKRAANLDRDPKPEIIAVGRKTQNIKIYCNHEGFHNHLHRVLPKTLGSGAVKVDAKFDYF